MLHSCTLLIFEVCRKGAQSHWLCPISSPLLSSRLHAFAPSARAQGKGEEREREPVALFIRVIPIGSFKLGYSVCFSSFHLTSDNNFPCALGSRGFGNVIQGRWVQLFFLGHWADAMLHQSFTKISMVLSQGTSGNGWSTVLSKKISSDLNN